MFLRQRSASSLAATSSRISRLAPEPVTISSAISRAPVGSAEDFGIRFVAPPRARGYAGGMSRPLRLLLVDDDEDALELMRRALLTFAPYEIECAANGAAALGLLRRNAPPPDLILLDLMMPIMNGRQFLRLVKSDPLLRSIPVVICTCVT